MNSLSKILLALSALAIIASPVQATPIQWQSSDGGNDHWYEIISDEGITWNEANTDASTLFGPNAHLATITSFAENSFIFNLGVEDHPYWLGGYQDDNAAPAEGWHWVTGEDWNYTQWAPGEPNDWHGTVENALAFAFFEGDGTWNDAPDSTRYLGNGGYVVEYDSAPVPEPATMLLFGTGLAGLAGLCRKKLSATNSTRQEQT